eukprot:Nitzschia sp. Nitz4//scaffold407_size10208//8033//9521//NITZ4_009082-RA/size10208-augustus-gene-0.3-mRNA-1//1//CDS//3329551138//8143//frame0
MSTSIIQLARDSGRCPPSLLRDDQFEEVFEAALAKVLDPNELCLTTTSSSDLEADFKTLMEMLASDSVASGDHESKVAILTQRRCVILAVVGATPPGSSALPHIMRAGFVGSVKAWLDDILNGSIGGVDLLLHLLSNISRLPVSRSDIKDTGMGKTIGSVEKHSICAGTPNEAAIKARVKEVMDAWKKSVKVNKDKSRQSETLTPNSPHQQRKRLELKI